MVGRCVPGDFFDVPSGACDHCRAGSYSPNGTACLACPTGGVCVRPSGAFENIGAITPATLPGFFLYAAQAGVLGGACVRLRAEQAPCEDGFTPGPGGKCAPNPARRDLVFTCATGRQLYACPVLEACAGGVTFGNLTGGRAGAGACNEGYRGALCAVRGAPCSGAVCAC